MIQDILSFHDSEAKSAVIQVKWLGSEEDEEGDEVN